MLSSGIIRIDYVKSSHNVSDLLTKGLAKEEVERSSKGMGLYHRTSHHGGNLPSRVEIPRARFKKKNNVVNDDSAFLVNSIHFPDEDNA